jgi:hypothetical protein
MPPETVVWENNELLSAKTRKEINMRNITWIFKEKQPVIGYVRYLFSF